MTPGTANSMVVLSATELSVPTLVVESAPPIPPLPARRPRLGLNGSSIALSLSLLTHAGLGLFAVSRLRATVRAAELGRTPVEFPAADLEVIVEKDEIRSAPARDPDLARPPPVFAESSLPRVLAPTASRVGGGQPLPFEPRFQPAPASGTPVADTPRFTITVAPVSGSSSADSTSNGTIVSAGSSPKSEPVAAARVDVPAQLRSGSVPAYTAAALSAGIEANVPLEIVIDENGVVTSARELERVGYGLDEAARQSVLGYRFSPALRSGQAVSVRMRWLMRFQLR